MKTLIIISTIFFAYHNCLSQDNCNNIGHIYLKPEKKKLVVYKIGEDSTYNLEISTNYYFDCCYDSIFKLNYEYAIDTSNFIFFTNLSFKEKIQKIRLAVITYHKLCNQKNKKYDTILSKQKSDYLDGNYSPMINEFADLWDKKSNADILNEIYKIRYCDIGSADLSTEFTLCKMFISNPKEFIRQLSIFNTKAEIQSSYFEQDLTEYINFTFKHKKNKDSIRKKYLDQFKRLTK